MAKEGFVVACGRREESMQGGIAIVNFSETDSHGQPAKRPV
jgi:hypothetical protein